MDYLTVIVNADVEISMSREVLEKIPYFLALIHGESESGPEKSGLEMLENIITKPQPNTIRANIPIVVEYRHLALISKIVRGIKVIPVIDLPSHADVLICLRLAGILGLDSEVVDEGFLGWTENRQWIELWQPEYLYLIWQLNSELVDFNKFFRLHKSAISSIVAAAEIEEIKSKPDLYIDMLIFFQKYDFAGCFEHSDAKVQDRIKTLNSERITAWKTFFINPYKIKDYFTHLPTHEETWACDGISAIDPPVIGQNTIADEETVYRRFIEFTRGKFLAPGNEKAKARPDDNNFPWSNVVIAGGSVSKLLSTGYNTKNARQSDVDLFVFGRTYDERSKIFERVIDWLHIPNQTYYGIVGSVVSVYFKDVSRKFQIISMNASTAWDIVSHFDMTHIQWCYFGDNFYGTPLACRSMKERSTRFNNVARLRTGRIIKAMHCGYNIIKSAEIAEKCVDFEQVLSNRESPSVQKMIRDLYSWYYPRSEPDMDPDEELQHILSQVEQDSKASLVTSDPKFVLNNVTIGGNFANNYESNLYTGFNPAIVEFKGQGNRIQRAVVRSKIGPIKLMTGILTVSKITVAENMELILRADDLAFRNFCNILETNVFRLYRNAGVTRNILTESNTLKVTITKYKLDAQVNKGYSIMRSQKGEPLNIEEDLREGDEIQFSFLIDIITTEEDRAVELRPLRFVKYVKHTVVSDETAGEILIGAEDIGFDGEITYEEAI